MRHLFYAMVMEAQAKKRLNLELEVESYLVRMLEYNTVRINIINTTYALKLLQATTLEDYREVGDGSVIHDGMFFERGIHYKPIGQSAYASAASLSGEELYNKLSYNYDKLVEILRGIKLPLQ